MKKATLKSSGFQKITLLVAAVVLSLNISLASNPISNSELAYAQKQVNKEIHKVLKNTPVHILSEIESNNSIKLAFRADEHNNLNLVRIEGEDQELVKFAESKFAEKEIKVDPSIAHKTLVVEVCFKNKN